MPEEEEEDPQNQQLAGAVPDQPGQAMQSGAQATSQQQDLLQTNAPTQGTASADQQALGSSSASIKAPEDRSESAAAAAPAEAAAAPPALPKQVCAGTCRRSVRSCRTEALSFDSMPARYVLALHVAQLDFLVHAYFKHLRITNSWWSAAASNNTNCLDIVC